MGEIGRRLAMAAVFTLVLSTPLVWLPLLRGEAVSPFVLWFVPLLGAIVGFLAWPVWRAAGQAAVAVPARRRLARAAAYMAVGLVLALAVSGLIQGGLGAGEILSAAVIFATILLFIALTPRLTGARRP